MRTIAVLNQKGGVGKTTTVANTAAALAAMGSRVVAIDLDPQAHLTIHLGFEPDTANQGGYRVLTQSSSIEQEVMLARMNLWLLPSNIDLVGAETELVSVVGREIILREALDAARDKFDYCLIDCPPSLGLLTLNALAAAQEVLIPLQPHFLALQGFGKLLQTVDLVNKRINPELKVKGILLCMYDSRPSLSNEVRADIEQFLENARGTNCAWADAEILPINIRRNIKLAEAPSYGRTIFEYEQNCHGAEDYLQVACYIHGIVISDKSKSSEQFTDDESELEEEMSESGSEPDHNPNARFHEDSTQEADEQFNVAGVSSDNSSDTEPAGDGYPINNTSGAETTPSEQTKDKVAPPFEIRSIRKSDHETEPEPIQETDSENTLDSFDLYGY